jgi:hypothetical protein
MMTIESFSRRDKGLILIGFSIKIKFKMSVTLQLRVRRSTVILFVEFRTRKALKRIRPKKAMESDGIPIEVWKCLGEISIAWLTSLFNNI